MKTQKTFDCVQIKNAAQERIEQEFAGLTDAERRVAIARELETSDDPVARKWRRLDQTARCIATSTAPAPTGR